MKKKHGLYERLRKETSKHLKCGHGEEKKNQVDAKRKSAKEDRRETNISGENKDNKLVRTLPALRSHICDQSFNAYSSFYIVSKLVYLSITEYVRLIALKLCFIFMIFTIYVIYDV